MMNDKKRKVSDIFLATREPVFHKCQIFYALNIEEIFHLFKSSKVSKKEFHLRKHQAREHCGHRKMESTNNSKCRL